MVVVRPEPLCPLWSALTCGPLALAVGRFPTGWGEDLCLLHRPRWTISTRGQSSWEELILPDAPHLSLGRPLHAAHRAGGADSLPAAPGQALPQPAGAVLR